MFYSSNYIANINTILDLDCYTLVPCGAVRSQTITIAKNKNPTVNVPAPIPSTRDDSFSTRSSSSRDDILVTDIDLTVQYYYFHSVYDFTMTVHTVVQYTQTVIT